MGNVKINIGGTGGGMSEGDVSFAGTVVTHKFTAEEIPQWHGFDGTGLPEGVLDAAANRLYA